MFTQQEANFLISAISNLTLNPVHADALVIVRIVQSIVDKIKMDQLPLPPKGLEQEQKIETPE